MSERVHYLAMALRLAIEAPDESRFRLAVQMADDLAAGMSKSDINRAKKIAKG